MSRFVKKRIVHTSGLFVGVLDYGLDIGIVHDVDLDPLARTTSRPLSSTAWATRVDPTLQTPGFIPPFALQPEDWISIQGSEFGQSLFIGRNRFALPPEWSNPDFPFVRALPNGNVLISDTSFEAAHKENTWILSREGEVQARFGVGSAAVEIAPLDGGLIAVAYHPLSAQRFGHRVEPQQRTAIAFFDHSGKLLTTFNHEASRSGYSAENVRCMTRISPLELIFVPERAFSDGQEVENPVIFYHCATGRTSIVSAPMAASEAVSATLGDQGRLWIQLASPEGYEDKVFAFDPVAKVSQYLGAFTGIFRGLVNSGISGQPSGPMSGFLAQETAAEYQWVLTEASLVERALEQEQRGFGEEPQI